MVDLERVVVVQLSFKIIIVKPLMLVVVHPLMREEDEDEDEEQLKREKRGCLRFEKLESVGELCA